MTVTVYVPLLRFESIFPKSFLKLGRPAVRIHTMKCSENNQLNFELTVFHVEPLLRNVSSIVVLPLNVRFPGDVGLVDGDRIVVGVSQGVGIGEDTLGNEPTRDGGGIRLCDDQCCRTIERCGVRRCGEICISNDWSAVT